MSRLVEALPLTLATGPWLPKSTLIHRLKHIFDLASRESAARARPVNESPDHTFVQWSSARTLEQYNRYILHGIFALRWFLMEDTSWGDLRPQMADLGDNDF